jgi:biopolymer transport protein ExbB
MKKYLMLMAGACASVSWSQTAVSTGEPVAEASTITMGQIIADGGPLMYPILLLSILSVCLIIFYFLTLRASLLFPKQFLQDARDAAEAGDLESLRELCQKDTSAAAKVIGSALSLCADGQPLDMSLVREAMEEEGNYQAGVLWQRIQYLMDIAVISPMVGLLGTVWGMMVSFSGLEAGVNFANKAATLASGVSQAMFTTFGGLIVGIVAMVFYALFRGKVNRLVNQLETSCGAVVRSLAFKLQAR